MSVKRLLNVKPSFMDSNGDPYTGARLFFYAAGSSTKQNTYTTSAGSVANANPIELNSRGEPATEIWGTVGQAYKIGLAIPGSDDPPASFIWTEDNVAPVNDTTVVLDEWVSGPTPTYVSASSFTLVGDQTGTFQPKRRLKLTVSAGTVYASILTSTYSSVTTVTISVDSGTLDAGLSAVSYGLLSVTNSSIPKATSSTITGNAALTAADFHLAPSLKNVTATATVSLPVVATVPKDHRVQIKSSTTGTVLISPNGSDTIDGSSANLQLAAYSLIELTSTGSAWLITIKPESFVGEIRPSAALTPTGWVECDNSALSRTTFAGLFNAISTTFGTGDGSTTFNLPDLAGRTLIARGAGSGLTSRTLAAEGGAETHTLSTAEMPAHTHAIGSVSLTGGAGSVIENPGSASTVSGSTGGGGAHNNMQPFTVVLYIIKT